MSPHQFAVDDVTYDLRNVVKVMPHPEQEGYVQVAFSDTSVARFHRVPFEKAYAASLAASTAPETRLRASDVGAAPASHSHGPEDLPGVAELWRAKTADDLRRIIGAALEGHQHRVVDLVKSTFAQDLLATTEARDARALLQASPLAHQHAVSDITGAGPVLDMVASAASTTELRTLLAAAPLAHEHTLRDVRDMSSLVASILSATSADEIRKLLGLHSAARADITTLTRTDDPRMTDARHPLPHTHVPTDLGVSELAAKLLTAASHRDMQQLLKLGTAARFDVPVGGNAEGFEIVRGDDSRLADARAPLAHQHGVADFTDVSAGWKAVLSGSADASTVLPFVADTGSEAPQVRVRGHWEALPAIPDPAAFAPKDHEHPRGPLPTLAELGAEKRGTAVDLHTVHAAEQQPHGATEFGAHLLRSTREEVWSALNLGTMAAQSREAYCKTTDQRLSDPRPPLPHAHNLRDLVGGTELGLKLLEASSQSALRDLLGLGSAALRRVPEMGAARPEELVKGNDPRLTNARTPEAHQHSPEDIMGFRQGYLDIPVMAADPEVAPAGRARLYATTTGELRMSIDGAPYRLV